MAIVDRVLVGEAMVGDGNEVAHIDLVMGPRGSAAEDAFCLALTNQKEGMNALLALLSPNLAAKPATVLFNKVPIKHHQQAAHVFGVVQRAVALAVVDCVAEGVIPANEAEDIFICAGVFVHWLAIDEHKIHDFNYEATKLAVTRAVKRQPSVAEVLEQKDKVLHPFAAK